MKLDRARRELCLQHGKRVLVPTLATIACALVAAPAVAHAAATLSLSIEPAVPGKGKPFQIAAQGTAENPAGTGGGSRLHVSFAPGTGSCASTAALEQANPDGHNFNTGVELGDGERFDRRLQYEPFVLRFGTGHYRSCGYLTPAGGSVPTAANRLEFTIGGTCASSTARQAKATRQLKTAKRQLQRAKQAGVSKRIKRATRRVKRAKRTLKAARTDRRALC